MLKRLTNRWQQQNARRAADVADCANFFFYGSLMERFSNFNRFIKKRVTAIEIGYCRGYLYTLPLGFPGLIVPEGSCSTLVAGEIMRFDNPLKVMKLLDRLEDYIPGNEKKSVYLRRKMTLICENSAKTPSRDSVAAQTTAEPHRMIEAWVYTYPAYHLSREHHREIRIECGQWKAFNGTTQPDATLQTQFERLSFCDHLQQVIVDPLLLEEPLFQRSAQFRSCFKACGNRHACGWNHRQSPSPT